MCHSIKCNISTFLKFSTRLWYVWRWAECDSNAIEGRSVCPVGQWANGTHKARARQWGAGGACVRDGAHRRLMSLTARATSSPPPGRFKSTQEVYFPPFGPSLQPLLWAQYCTTCAGSAAALQGVRLAAECSACFNCDLRCPRPPAGTERAARRWLSCTLSVYVSVCGSGCAVMEIGGYRVV